MKIGFDPYALNLQVVKITGVEAKLRCPFHSDKTPSATFNLSTGLFHCFGCNYNANVYRLIKELGGFIRKIDIASVPHAEEVEREWRQLAYSPLAIDDEYLISRGVTNEQIVKFNILKNENGILFPIFNHRGVLSGVQLRKYHGDPKYILNGERTPVWPMSNLRHHELLLVEGVFGVIRADKYGINAVCVMGASIVESAAKVLQGHKVKVVFDDDIAGYLGAHEFLRHHKDAAVVVPGCEVDELKRKGFERLLQNKGTQSVISYAIDTNQPGLISQINRKDAEYVKKSKAIARAAARNRR